MTKKAASCCWLWAFLCARPEERTDGTYCEDRKGTEEAQVQGSFAQPWPLLRPRARVYPQVSDVPYLFSRYGAQGRNSRRHESQLVGFRVCTCLPQAGLQTRS